MKKLFISQPMRGLTQEQIQKARSAAVESATRFLGEEVEVIDSIFTDVAPDNPLKALAKSLDAMADADAVYFAAGWEDARGCRIEFACADQYGLPIIGAVKGYQ